jgi:hypothetical protein
MSPSGPAKRERCRGGVSEMIRAIRDADLEGLNPRDHHFEKIRSVVETAIRNRLKQNGAWAWTVPEKADPYPVTSARKGTGEHICLNIFSTVSGSLIKNERLNGCRIGKYPAS